MSSTATLGADSDSISRLGEPDRASLPADIGELYQANHDDNWIRALAVNPDTARRFGAYFASLFSSGRGARLSLAERELIAVIVSAENGCGLCEIHHTIALGEQIDDHARARRIALDHHLAPLSPREEALAAFAVKVTRAPKTVSGDDFRSLRAAGLDDADILEALETSSWFNHTNRIFISLGVKPDDKFFAR
ncbi:putative peroxidase-related enzyme [Roseiarcus fermentans]|uniref:Putative peroxidase-related enzyme n=1 Tax=Roseiarcus fermentans TaxID=1473586 RepID=A0A366FQ53_9HYPH|nr:peroxidase-related enzyme [Roseiarcus fermentans]RBP16792.1 putative peroxidase-related enzyme [Roseiarcus fermentans]